jgi:hypothetical protein
MLRAIVPLLLALFGLAAQAGEAAHREQYRQGDLAAPTLNEWLRLSEADARLFGSSRWRGEHRCERMAWRHIGGSSPLARGTLDTVPVLSK